jgi:hypothetical protein
MASCDRGRETTSSGARFCSVAGLGSRTSDSAQTGSVSRYDDLKPILVERLRTETPASWIARVTPPACRADRCGIWRKSSPILNYGARK